MLHLILMALAVLAVYSLFVLVKATRRCPRCNGWGQKAKRRSPRACSRCKATGTTFWPGARLVHKGVAAAYKQVRTRTEGER